MQNPDTYRIVSDKILYMCEEFLKEYGPKIKWTSDGTDSMLDVGCGLGNTTVKYIEPLLPANYQRLVGGDLSKSMVAYARDNFTKDKIEYVQMDVEGDISDVLCQYREFNHVISMKTLHWCDDQLRAFKNVHKLLRPDGDFIFTYFWESIPSHLFLEMSRNKQWSKYYKGVSSGKLHISPAVDECRKNLNVAGFRDIELKLKPTDLKFTTEVFEGLMLSLDPVVNKLPVELQQNYMDDMMDIARGISHKNYPEEIGNDCIAGYYPQILGYAAK